MRKLMLAAAAVPALGGAGRAVARSEGTAIALTGMFTAAGLGAVRSTTRFASSEDNGAGRHPSHGAT